MLLFYSTTSVRLCGFASAFYRRFSLPKFRAYRRNMTFPNHVSHRLVSTAPYALGDNIDASRVISLRFARGITFFLVVCLSLPLGILPFRCWAFLASLAPATWYYGILAIATVYGPMLSTTGFTLRAPRRFHVSGPVLTLQPICRFFWPLHSCLVVPAPKSPLLSGSVLAL